MDTFSEGLKNSCFEQLVPVTLFTGAATGRESAKMVVISFLKRGFVPSYLGTRTDAEALSSGGLGAVMKVPISRSVSLRLASTKSKASFWSFDLSLSLSFFNPIWTDFFSSPKKFFSSTF